MILQIKFAPFQTIIDNIKSYQTLLDHLDHLGPYKTNFNHSRSFWVIVGHFEKNFSRAFFIYFILLKSYWAPFDQFGPVWTCLDLKTILTYLDLFGSSGPIWTHLKPSGPICTQLDLFLPNWTHFNAFQPIRTHLDPFRAIWTNQDTHAPIWTHLEQFGQIRTHLHPFGPI